VPKFQVLAPGLYWAKQREQFSYSHHVPKGDGQIAVATAEVVRQFSLRMAYHQPIWTCLGMAVLAIRECGLELRVTAFREQQ